MGARERRSCWLGRARPRPSSSSGPCARWKHQSRRRFAAREASRSFRRIDGHLACICIVVYILCTIYVLWCVHGTIYYYLWSGPSTYTVPYRTVHSIPPIPSTMPRATSPSLPLPYPPTPWPGPSLSSNPSRAMAFLPGVLEARHHRPVVGSLQDCFRPAAGRCRNSLFHADWVLRVD